jgi:Ca2+-binding EF-hand superfamily protein
VKRFLAVLKYFGDEFWVYPDDDVNSGLDNFLIKEKPVVEQVKAKERYSYIKFQFSNYDFAIEVRKRMLQALTPFDKNRDNLFDEKEITDALVQLLKENQHEVYYMVKNVFRYDRNLDGKVSYDELTDFCVEQHFGEMAIQRLHRKKGNYQRADKREMNKQEFGKTLEYALKAIDIRAPQNIIDLLFSEIDLNKSGWITYEVYFLFLKYYFGSQNIVFKKNTELDEWD